MRKTLHELASIVVGGMYLAGFVLLFVHIVKGG